MLVDFFLYLNFRDSQAIRKYLADIISLDAMISFIVLKNSVLCIQNLSYSVG